MMILNNEQAISTSEKSARYTKFRPENGVAPVEAELYEKWLELLQPLIRNRYGNEPYIQPSIEKKAQENARYFTSIRTETRAIMTTNWMQWNRVASFMIELVDKNCKTPFEQLVAPELASFVTELARLGILDNRAMSNRKQRKLRIFGNGNKLVEPHFGDTYSMHYKGSFAQLAQAHRHRTIRYDMVVPDDYDFYFPPILRSSPKLLAEWRFDALKVAENYPQGQLIWINEKGNLEDFILKCKERLCSAAQLEIMQQTHATLEQYRNALGYDEELDCYLLDNYAKGARCTFPDYTCAQPCSFVEGINLTRLI